MKVKQTFSDKQKPSTTNIVTEKTPKGCTLGKMKMLLEGKCVM